MFTGLIEATGRVERVAEEATGRRLTVTTALGSELSPGDSIAVNGVCLTVVAQTASSFDAIISPETLRVTTFESIRAGSAVNLERPVRADARLGGHFVLGHVDGVGRIEALRPDGDCFWLEVSCPRELAPLFIPKGSIAIDGTSLTIAALRETIVCAQIVPFTWEHTSLRQAKMGDAVNIEADVLGKYVARLLGKTALADTPALPAGIS
jgi:riboflavin synthase